MTTNAGCFVRVSVTCEDVTRSQVHPVTDNRNQTIAQPEPSGPSVGGVSLTTGMGWGVDVGIILLIVGFLYVMKKFVDKWIK